MSKGRRRGFSYPTDREAGADAQTAQQPMNREETARTAARTKAAETGEPAVRCAKCDPLPALSDYRGTHKCARCRSEAL